MTKANVITKEKLFLPPLVSVGHAEKQMTSMRLKRKKEEKKEDKKERQQEKNKKDSILLSQPSADGTPPAPQPRSLIGQFLLNTDMRS